MEAQYDISNNLLDNIEEIPQKSGKSSFLFSKILIIKIIINY
jgi:hypothetical protein